MGIWTNQVDHDDREQRVVPRQPNTVLASLLAQVGWSPRVLAQRINHAFGHGTVALTTPYQWRDAGRVPRAPLPALVAWVLSRELGQPVTVAELWQGQASDSPLMLPADVEMGLPWTKAGTLGVIDDWVMSGLLDRRYFLAVSGTALAAATSLAVFSEAGSLTSALDGGGVGHPLIQQIEQSIPLLQRLDDANGGGAHLAYVGAQFRAVAVLLRQGGHTSAIERRLFAALAELGQLAGWMAFDAGQHGLGQRYFFTALRAAKEARNRSMAAHVLGDLGFQAATREQPTDAVALGTAAARLSDGVPATVRASVASRLAYGYAIAGQLAEFEASYQSAQEALTDRKDYEEPEWMYFLTPNHLDTQAGYALVHAGTVNTDGDRAARPLFRKGEQLLRSGAHDFSLSHPSQRRALFEGAWLAVAAASRGNLEQACSVGRTAIARIRNVHSPRSISVLRTLASRLRRRARNEHVADFLPTLDAALAR
ncbi:hypothetical protein LWC34_41820 [Kibdelosporangium philippinense]|uniref:Transcriptional regulator n=1 Tax=Kibdelosporangium philippinense TaxID=211113 RepID=A0ABS8ZP26_9PSEU|nr:hypothetical protein [Kibdelosporangium philippinense]MCE7009309.1 hypothetical protein [Kibdelosporangium philippinense]